MRRVYVLVAWCVLVASVLAYACAPQRRVTVLRPPLTPPSVPLVPIDPPRLDGSDLCDDGLPPVLVIGDPSTCPPDGLCYATCDPARHAIHVPNTLRAPTAN